jgi:hypothetical protein
VLTFVELTVPKHFEMFSAMRFKNGHEQLKLVQVALNYIINSIFHRENETKISPFNVHNLYRSLVKQKQKKIYLRPVYNFTESSQFKSELVNFGHI